MQTSCQRRVMNQTCSLTQAIERLPVFANSERTKTKCRVHRVPMSKSDGQFGQPARSLTRGATAEAARSTGCVAKPSSRSAAPRWMLTMTDPPEPIRARRARAGRVRVATGKSAGGRRQQKPMTTTSRQNASCGRATVSRLPVARPDVRVG